MVRADQRAGRRSAHPEARGRRPRARARRPRPAAAPASPQGLEASRDFAVRRLASSGALGTLWLLGTLLALLAMAIGWTPWDEPAWLPMLGAVTVTTLYALGLAFRTGGRPVISAVLALVLALAAVVSELPVALAAAAAGTAVVAAVLGVMSTKPAVGFGAVARECVIATVVTAVGAVAVEAYQAQVSLERIGYLALGLSLIGTLALAYRLGGGWHGLGNRGITMLVTGLALLFVTLAYTEALSRWGSPGMIDRIDDLIRGIRSSIGAVPRPVAVLLGFPALAWGVFTRARRRQGWWVTAFGAAGLAVIAVALLNPMVSLLESALTVLYSLVLGLLLGYLVIRADAFLTGARGRQGRQLEEASAHRPEPGRMRPLS